MPGVHQRCIGMSTSDVDRDFKMDEKTKYKTDKLIDYFKYIATANIATIALLVSLKDKLEFEIKFATPIISVFLILSLGLSYYGYYTIVDKLFEPQKNHEKIVRFCRRYSGAILVAVIGTLALNLKIT